MGVTLKKILANSSKIKVMIGEDTVNMEYYPGKINERSIVDLDVGAMQASTQQEAIDRYDIFNERLADVLKSWDIYEDDAQTIIMPITKANLEALPLLFRLQIFQAILGDMRPNVAAPSMPTQNIGRSDGGSFTGD